MDSVDKMWAKMVWNARRHQKWLYIYNKYWTSGWRRWLPDLWG